MASSPVHKVITHRLEVDPSAPGRARRLVVEALGHHPRIDDILLATSELVTNVVRHGHDVTHAELTLDRLDGSVKVGVRQRGGEFDRVQHLATDPHGRGLAIVEAVTDRWGVDDDGDPLVWFEIST
jgi:anti-sigma regulatory factor (Ser/Thr protein kinase)